MDLDARDEERLMRLEENAYFQEEKLRELDAQIMDQHKQLAELSLRVEDLARALTRLRDALEAGKPGATGTEAPPHYDPRQW